MCNSHSFRVVQRFHPVCVAYHANTAERWPVPPVTSLLWQRSSDSTLPGIWAAFIEALSRTRILFGHVARADENQLAFFFLRADDPACLRRLETTCELTFGRLLKIVYAPLVGARHDRLHYRIVRASTFPYTGRANVVFADRCNCPGAIFGLRGYDVPDVSIVYGLRNQL